jgi:hypothetical protein
MGAKNIQIRMIAKKLAAAEMERKLKSLFMVFRRIKMARSDDFDRAIFISGTGISRQQQH